jgi:hypothetical protein
LRFHLGAQPLHNEPFSRGDISSRRNTRLNPFQVPTDHALHKARIASGLQALSIAHASRSRAMKKTVIEIVEDPDGTKRWCRDGNWHRDDGPAVERPDGTKEWYRDGKRIPAPRDETDRDTALRGLHDRLDTALACADPAERVLQLESVSSEAKAFERRIEVQAIDRAESIRQKVVDFGWVVGAAVSLAAAMLLQAPQLAAFIMVPGFYSH